MIRLMTQKCEKARPPDNAGLRKMESFGEWNVDWITKWASMARFLQIDGIITSSNFAATPGQSGQGSTSLGSCSICNSSLQSLPRKLFPSATNVNLINSSLDKDLFRRLSFPPLSSNKFQECSEISYQIKQNLGMIKKVYLLYKSSICCLYFL